MNLDNLNLIHYYLNQQQQHLQDQLRTVNVLSLNQHELIDKNERNAESNESENVKNDSSSICDTSGDISNEDTASDVEHSCLRLGESKILLVFFKNISLQIKRPFYEIF